jgi:hypothetical protein
MVRLEYRIKIMGKENEESFGAQWRAMQREAQLAAEQAAHGVTTLGRANHAETGYYTQAFFALSIGLERRGTLLAKCEDIGNGVNQDRDYRARPNEPIHQGIENVLSLFATKLRYYNLNHLAGADRGQEDPVALRWKKVAVPICDRHYSDRQREKDEAEAIAMESLIGDISTVMHTTETGDSIRDVHSFLAEEG